MGLSNAVVFVASGLILLAIVCWHPSHALKCDAVGCRFCVTRRMQLSCAAYCAACSAGTATTTKGPGRSERPIPSADHENSKRSPQGHNAVAGSSCGSPPDYRPCVALKDANELFHDCCENLNIGPCIRLCHYDVTLNKARHMFDNGICTVEMIPKYLYCASQGKDNTECCSKFGVFTAGRDRCRKFCSSGKNQEAITTKDVSCASQMNKILSCHLGGLR